MGLLLLVQAFILSAIRTGTSFDGAEQLLYTQYFDWGYGRAQPPLYSWLLILMHKLFGVTQLAENVLKFSLLFTALVLLRRVALELGFHKPAATAVMLGALLNIDMAWEIQRNYSHTALLVALSPALALVYLKLSRQRHPAQYLLFGLVAGMLALAKYNSLVAIPALLIADLIVQRRMSIMTGKWFWLSCLVFFLITAPHLYWAYANPDQFGSYSGSFGLTNSSWNPGEAVQSLASFGLAAIAVFGPSLLIVFARLHKTQGLKRPSAIITGLSREHRVMVLWGLFFLGAGLLAAVTAGSTRIVPRWLLPAFLILIPVLVGSLAQADRSAMKAFVWTGVMAFVIASSGQWIHSVSLNPRTGYDYQGFAGALPQTQAILFSEYQIFANLRLYLPQVHYINHVMPKRETPGTEQAIALFTEHNMPKTVVNLAAQLGLCQDGDIETRTLGSVYNDSTLPVRLARLSPCKN